MHILEILIQYFYSWRSYFVILVRLKRIHGLSRSLSWLKKQFRTLKLKRRCKDPSEVTVKALITKLVQTSAGLRGYRAVWKLLRDKHGCVVRRDTVMRLLKEVDAEGISYRAKRKLKRRVYVNKGPNYLWHIDWYDKL